MTATQFAPVLTVVDADRPDDNLPVDELGSRIVGMSGRLAAATCRWLSMVAEFDQREGYLRFGLHSTAYWLSHHCGIARRTALAHLLVARALAAFPALAEQMSVGSLSYSRCGPSPGCLARANTPWSPTSSRPPSTAAPLNWRH